MPLNKEALINRLHEMFYLPLDWDGFNSFPICKKVHDVARDMIDFIQVDVNLRIFVGVEIDGSLFCEIRRASNPHCRIELTILPDGLIDYVEIRDADILSEGSLMLSYEAINDILG
jgi:hypothetical protein